jgi:hypothetical protein
MIRRRATVGLGLLCALLFSAFAAQSASAIKGTTGFTCAPEPNPTKETKGFKDAHCKEGRTGLEVKFIHKEIEPALTTKFHATNEKTQNKTTESTPFILRFRFVGIPFTLTCEKVFGHGNLTNNVHENKEHYVHGTEVTFLFSNCKLTGSSECKVSGEKLEFKNLTVTTTAKGDNVTFSPEKGTEIGNFKLEECKIKELNVELKISGSITAQSDGATLNFAHNPMTLANELIIASQPAGIEASITVSQSPETAESGKTGNPIGFTTVET